MEIRFAKPALRYLSRQPRNRARKILAAIRSAAEQGGIGAQVVRLKDRDARRLRVGGVRVLFTVHDGVLLVVKIGSRGDVYK